MTRILLILSLFTLVGCAHSPTVSDNEKTKNELLVNQHAPVDTLETIFNENIQLSGTKYKVSILLFFDLDCIHCVNAINAIEQTLMPVLDKKNYQFIGTGVKHSKEYLI